MLNQDSVYETTMEFFSPTQDFLDWWVDYIGDSFVIEAGSGTGKFLESMRDLGIHVLGFEPNASGEVLAKFYNALIPHPIQGSGIVRDNKAIVVAARPNHSGWVNMIPDIIHPESEFIYIGFRDNFGVDGIEGTILYENAGNDGEVVVKVKR